MCVRMCVREVWHVGEAWQSSVPSPPAAPLAKYVAAGWCDKAWKSCASCTGTCCPDLWGPTEGMFCSNVLPAPRPGLFHLTKCNTGRPLQGAKSLCAATSAPKRTATRWAAWVMWAGKQEPGAGRECTAQVAPPLSLRRSTWRARACARRCAPLCLPCCSCSARCTVQPGSPPASGALPG